MVAFEIITTTLLIYTLQIMVACMFNWLCKIDPANNLKEFILLTFLPYTMYKAWMVETAKENKKNADLLDNIW